MDKAHTREVLFADAGSGHAAAPAASGAADCALGAAEWLHLAAAPTFAAMALLTSIQSSGQPDVLCSAMQNASPLGGMVPMYVLMAAFHLSPWLKLISRRRRFVRRPCHAATRGGDPISAGGNWLTTI